MISGVRASSIRIEVHLVDDGERVPALDHLVAAHLHVVAQIVEAEFVVGGVRHVAGIGGLALFVVEPVHDDADREAQEAVDLPHPLAVALGEIVVHGDDMHALAGQRIEVHRERGDQRLAFARLHLGDVALVKHHAADHLHVEVPLLQRAPRGLAHGCERRSQNAVERRAVRDLAAKLDRAFAQLLVAQRLDFRLQRIDRIDLAAKPFHTPVIGRAENLCRDRAEGKHERSFLECKPARYARHASCGSARDLTPRAT